MEKELLGQITIEDIVDELKRELRVRRSVYPKWVEEGKITASCANHRINCLEVALLNYQEIIKKTSSQKSLF